MRDDGVIRIIDVVGGSICVSADDGQAIHEKILSILRDGRKVSLSFEGVGVIIPAFLNATIGELYWMLADNADDLLSVRDISADQSAMLKCVIDNAKRYHDNREAFDQAWREVVGGDE